MFGISKSNAPTLFSRYRGSLLGLAIGDALGAPFEFCERKDAPAVVDMEKVGPFGSTAGSWTDDTAMALCLADSLVEKKGFDLQDQIERYCRWYKDGYLRCPGRHFDIGITTRQALDRFITNGIPQAGSSDPYSAGNGAIMRLAPVPLFYRRHPEKAIEMAGLSSLTTHGAAECVDACRLLAAAIIKALNGASKKEVLSLDPKLVHAPRIAAIARGEYHKKDMAAIRGSGYVVDALEAALWCFDTTNSYEASVLKAVSLGEDTDTTAAICGQLAGAFYGMDAIPTRWLQNLEKRELVKHYADALYRCAEATPEENEKIACTIK